MREAYRLNQLKMQQPEAIKRDQAYQAHLDRTDLSKVKVW